MELLNIWVISVILSFSNSPDYQSHYQVVTFNSQNGCQEFLDDKRIELEHDLIHVFENQPEKLIKINFNCEILEGDTV
tara:strand:+ start:61 stop:294 length:234 start_codon:yes stop_codon:yes gene_type:complete